MTLDERLFRLINHLPHPLWADQLTLFLDYLGEAEVQLRVAGILLVVGIILKRRKLWLGATFLVATILSTAGIIMLMKHFFNRPRPYATLNDIYVFGHATGASFPSGHAGIYAALGAFMILYFKRARIFWAALIFFGGVARIYQGVHFPSDVLESWGVSFAMAWAMVALCHHAERKHEKRPHTLEKS